MADWDEQRFRVAEWHKQNGGHANNGLAGHAIRAMHEMVELCIACGANGEMIIDAVRQELRRDHHNSDVREELADVSLCLDIIDVYSSPMRELYWDRQAKMEINDHRKFEADENGVLWRPGHGRPGYGPTRTDQHAEKPQLADSDGSEGDC